VKTQSTWQAERLRYNACRPKPKDLAVIGQAPRLGIC
jgi:hypothetical protein